MFLLHKKTEINFQIASKTLPQYLLTTLTYVATVHIGKSALARCVLGPR